MRFEKDMEGVTVKISDLKPNPKNPRIKETKRAQDELKNSLLALGQLNPLLIDEDGVILSGHRRYECAKLIGWTSLKCNVKTNLSEFNKSAVLLSANVTHENFNAWAHRNAIAKIYWDEFLEEYHPKSALDKGYTVFAQKVGLSVPYIKRIVEVYKGSGKELNKRMEEAGVSTHVANTVLASNVELREYLSDIVIKRHLKNKLMERPSRTRTYIELVKKKFRMEKASRVTLLELTPIFDKLEDLELVLTDDILKKAEPNLLKRLKITIEKSVIPFYEKLEKTLG